MSNDRQGRFVLVEGALYERSNGGALVPVAHRSDHELLDAMDETLIEDIARSDPDGAFMPDEDWAQASIAQPERIPVDIQLDGDVVQWFRSGGQGYQDRMNAVLRRYIQSKR